MEIRPRLVADRRRWPVILPVLLRWLILMGIGFASAASLWMLNVWLEKQK